QARSRTLASQPESGSRQSARPEPLSACELIFSRHRRKMILRDDFKLSGRSMSRVGTYPDRHASRFDLKLVLIAPDCEGVRRKCKTHVLRFTWTERHAFKSLQNPHRLR